MRTCKIKFIYVFLSLLGGLYGGLACTLPRCGLLHPRNTRFCVYLLRARVSDSKTSLLWVHLVTVYAFSGVALYLMVQHSKDYARMRHRFLLKRTYGAHSVLVLDLDSAYTNAMLWDRFATLFPDQVVAVSMIEFSKDAQRAAKEREAAVLAYERAVFDYKVCVRASYSTCF